MTTPTSSPTPPADTTADPVTGDAITGDDIQVIDEVEAGVVDEVLVLAATSTSVPSTPAPTCTLRSSRIA